MTCFVAGEEPQIIIVSATKREKDCSTSQRIMLLLVPLWFVLVLVGNSHWRQLVFSNKELYLKLPKNQKQLLSKSIVHAIRSQNPPGRFLQKNAETDLWYDVGDVRALEKTSQALREGAPKLKAKLNAPPKKSTDDSKNGQSAERTGGVVGTSSQEQGHSQQNNSSALPTTTLEPQGLPKKTTLAEQTTAGSNGCSIRGASLGNSVATGTTTKIENSARIQPNMAQQQQIHPLQHGQAPPTISTFHSSTHEVFVHPIVLPPQIPPQGPVPERKKKKTPIYSKDASHISPAHNNLLSDDRRQHHLSGPPAENHNDDQQLQSFSNTDMPAPPDGGLAEHQGFSFGTVMSVETQNFAIEPPTPIQPNEFSLGSLVLTDQEVTRLASAEEGKPVEEQVPDEPHVRFQAQNEPRENTNYEQSMPAPVDLGLEPAGLSAGSMMSCGTIASAINKLENGGLSFGSVMSFSTSNVGTEVPSAVDGGLEEIGASFGSMTIGADGFTKHAPTGALPTTTPGPTLATNAISRIGSAQNRSKGSLLECSDTESEDEDTSGKSSAQKSAEWEKLKATFQYQVQNGFASAPPSLVTGISLTSRQASLSRPATLNIPTANLGRDVSAMSAMSGGGGNDENDLFLSHNQYYPHGNEHLVQPPPPSLPQGNGSWKEYDAA